MSRFLATRLRFLNTLEAITHSVFIGFRFLSTKPKGPLSYPSVFIYKDSVFEATSVFEAAAQKQIAVPKQKPKALFHLLRFLFL